MALLVLVMLLAGFLVLARAARREARDVVHWQRRWRVSLALAVLVTLPAVPAWVSSPVLLRDFVARDRIELHPRGELVVRSMPPPRPDGRPELLVVVVVWITLLSVARDCLRLPRALGHLSELPPVTDAALVARIAEIAECLRLPPPRVLERPSLGGSMDVFAFAAGVLEPVVVVTDGIGARLPAHERDAILAHEMAHVAHRSVWAILITWAVVGVLAVAASGFVEWYVALAWGVASGAFARSLLGHHDEVAADRAAARCVGAAAMVAALDKVHAANRVDAQGAWSHAIATHPALVVRAAALGMAQQDGDRRAVQRCVRTRRLVVLAGAMVLVAVLLIAGLLELPGVAAAIAALVIVTRFVPLLAHLRELRDRWQLRRRLRRSIGFQRVAMLFAAVALLFVALVLVDDHPPAALAATIISLTVLVLAAVWRRRERNARRRLLPLFVAGRFEELLAAAQDLPGRWRRSAWLGPLIVLSSAAVGRFDESVAVATDLAGRRARSRTDVVWLARLVREREPDRAIELLESLSGEVPGNAVVRASLAAHLLHAGRADQARHHAERLCRERPIDGNGRALLARVAVASGAFEAAERHLAEAEHLAPGDVSVALARAELDVARRAPGARESLDALRALDERMPLALLGESVARLEAALQAEADSPTTSSSS